MTVDPTTIDPQDANAVAVAALHPGKILWSEFLKPKELTVHRFAEEIGVHVHLVDNVIHGVAPVTPGLARLFGHYLKTSPHFWLGLQLDYDLDNLKDTEVCLVPISASTVA